MKDVSEKENISEEAVNPKSFAEEPIINPSEEEDEVLLTSPLFKCGQFNFTSNSDKGLKCTQG